MHFFAEIFGQFKKKQYFCTLFRRNGINEGYPSGGKTCFAD